MDSSSASYSSSSESFNRFESPTRARIQQLANKLSGLQANIEDEKHARLEAIEHRLRNTDARINQVLAAHEKRLLTLRDSVIQSEQNLEDEKRCREELSEAKAADIGAADARLQVELEAEIKARKEGESKLVAQLDEKLRNILLEIGSKEQYSYRTTWDTARIRDSLSNERGAREDAEQRIYGNLEREVQEVMDLIEMESRQRDASQESLIKMLQEAASRIRLMLETEKREREQAEDALLALLEDTCVKINTAQSL